MNEMGLISANEVDFQKSGRFFLLTSSKFENLNIFYFTELLSILTSTIINSKFLYISVAEVPLRCIQEVILINF